MRFGTIQRLTRDESGMAMGLAIITMVLIGVMGAGFLTFVVTDLNAVVEVNQGQRAFEMADAGVQAAKRQLDANSDPIYYDNPDLGSDNVQWSANTANSDCPDLGGYGMCLKNLDGASGTDDSVNVMIEKLSADSFKVVSTGGYGEAKRRIEAKYSISSIRIPEAYYSRGFVDFGGSPDISGVSVFSENGVTVGGSASVGDAADGKFKKWAAPSYPNAFNIRERVSDKVGIGTGGKLTFAGSASTRALASENGTRHYANSYESGQEPPSGTPRFVNDVGTDGQDPATEITFPFDASASRDAADIEILRKRAKQLEAKTGYNYYRNTSSTGGALSGSLTITGVDTTGDGSDNTGWPPDSKPDTVVFYDYPSYADSNVVSWSIRGGCPRVESDPPPDVQGVLVVNRGNFKMLGNNEFAGVIVVRSGNVLDEDGTATTGGTSCVAGYINASGNITTRGTADTSYSVDLSKLPAFRTAEVQSWRELYE